MKSIGEFIKSRPIDTTKLIGGVATCIYFCHYQADAIPPGPYKDASVVLGIGALIYSASKLGGASRELTEDFEEDIWRLQEEDQDTDPAEIISIDKYRATFSEDKPLPPGA